MAVKLKSVEDATPSTLIRKVMKHLNANCIQSAAELILNEIRTDEEIQRILITLCTWLPNQQLNKVTSALLMRLVRKMEEDHRWNVLCEVMYATVEKLFKLLVVVEIRDVIGPVVQYMFTLPDRLIAFKKIVPHVAGVVAALDKENTESSGVYMETIIRWTLTLFEELPHSDMCEPLKQHLVPIILRGGCTRSLDSVKWSDESAVSPTAGAAGSALARVGLNNLGNTCYMNSVLQALYMTKPFRNEVLLYDKTIMSLFAKLQTLFALLQHSRRTSLSPDEVLAVARPPGFLPGHQHDSSEFLGYLVDVLHEQEKNVTMAPTDGTSAPPYTIVQSSFGGRTVSVSSCGVCDNKSERVDNFRELQLSFPTDASNQSVQTLLDYYLQSEKLCGDNQYHCELCAGLRDGERVTSIEEAPRRLILTLKHFQYDPSSQRRTKLLQSIKLDNDVYLEGVHYELYSAIVHCGSSVDSGHYYTFAKDTQQDWYKFNDCIVRKATADDLYALKSPETPYILFYSKVDGVDIGDVPCEALPKRLQVIVAQDHADFDAEKRRTTARPYNTRRNNQNDEQPPPPPGCGSGGFSIMSANMYIY